METPRTRILEAAEALRQILDGCASRELTLAEFARTHNTSRDALRRRFKRAFGSPPKQYRVLARVTAAKKMLAESHLPVGTIAHLCGYYDAAQFSRLFRRDTGVTPSQYRQQMHTQMKGVRYAAS